MSYLDLINWTFGINWEAITPPANKIAKIPPPIPYALEVFMPEYICLMVLISTPPMPSSTKDYLRTYHGASLTKKNKTPETRITPPQTKVRILFNFSSLIKNVTATIPPAANNNKIAPISPGTLATALLRKDPV